MHSIRFLYQHFSSGITTKSLNTFYHACSYAKVDYSHFMNITAKVALRMFKKSSRIWILSAMPGLILSCMILLLHIPAAEDVPPNMGRDFLLKYIPLFLYSFRWNIETSYYEQKTFWSLCSYMVRSCKGIEMLVNLINICYCAMTKALKQLIRQQVY